MIYTAQVTIFHLPIQLYGFMLRKEYTYNMGSYATIMALNLYVNTSFLQMAAFRKLTKLFYRNTCKLGNWGANLKYHWTKCTVHLICGMHTNVQIDTAT